MADGASRPRLRALLRAVHRDAGYLAVGLTLVYALSGLAVNHLADWDPNFRRVRAVHELGAALPGDDGAVAARVLARLGVRERPREVYRAGPTRLDVLLDHRTLHIDPTTGRVVDEAQRPRVLLRALNWLHLNRGKRAWTVVADLYAVGLLVLAATGLVMLPGRRGLIGRRGLLVALGVAVPVVYVTLSGGP